MAKGLELPVNMLVVIAIAVIVLLGVVALYLVGFGGPASGITLQSITTNACQDLLRAGTCSDANAVFSVQIPKFDANKDGTSNPGPGKPTATSKGQDNLGTLCINYYAATYDTTKLNDFREACNVRVCGCSS
ncbi:MAG TPA: hypothetical protein VJH90_03055 [archaeon]|nr:hypothetical protein [archaeon]